jgi:hypothetical protein
MRYLTTLLVLRLYGVDDDTINEYEAVGGNGLDDREVGVRVPVG